MSVKTDDPGAVLKARRCSRFIRKRWAASGASPATRNLISGGALALAQHPQQRDALADDPSLNPNAVEEMLRWVSCVRSFICHMNQATELRGQKIREGLQPGSAALLCLASVFDHLMAAEPQRDRRTDLRALGTLFLAW